MGLGMDGNGNGYGYTYKNNTKYEYLKSVFLTINNTPSTYVPPPSFLTW